MYCSKCGAAVAGKYCCCCGTRVRTSEEEVLLLERQRKKQFIDSCLMRYPYQDRIELRKLAEACWTVGKAKSFVPGKEESVSKTELTARFLFDQF